MSLAWSTVGHLSQKETRHRRAGGTRFIVGVFGMWGGKKPAVVGVQEGWNRDGFHRRGAERHVSWRERGQWGVGDSW